MNAQEPIQQHRHRDDDPERNRDPQRDRERVARPQDLEDAVLDRERVDEHGPDRRGKVEADRRARDHGQDRPDDPRPEGLGEMVHQGHRLIGSGRSGFTRTGLGRDAIRKAGRADGVGVSHQEVAWPE